MRPEAFTSFSDSGNYTGPALLRLKDGAWMLLFDLRQFTSGNTVAVAAPTLGNRLLQKSSSELEALLDDPEGFSIQGYEEYYSKQEMEMLEAIQRKLRDQ